MALCLAAGLLFSNGASGENGELVTEEVPSTGSATRRPAAGALSFVVADTIPNDRDLPDLSANLPGSWYVAYQREGMVPFIGFIANSIIVSERAKAIAREYKDRFLGVDIRPPVVRAFSLVSDEKNVEEARLGGGLFVVKPYVFVNMGYDRIFRLSLVFHLEGGDQSSPWVGRYVYHLPTVYPEDAFRAPLPEQLRDYEVELAKAAEMLARLVLRDLRGELPPGKRARVGSMFLTSARVGALGIYDMPEKIVFRRLEVLAEENGQVVVRSPAALLGHAWINMATLHIFQRPQLHTLRY